LLRVGEKNPPSIFLKVGDDILAKNPSPGYAHSCRVMGEMIYFPLSKPFKRTSCI